METSVLLQNLSRATSFLYEMISCLAGKGSILDSGLLRQEGKGGEFYNTPLGTHTAPPYCPQILEIRITNLLLQKQTKKKKKMKLAFWPRRISKVTGRGRWVSASDTLWQPVPSQNILYWHSSCHDFQRSLEQVICTELRGNFLYPAKLFATLASVSHLLRNGKTFSLFVDFPCQSGLDFAATIWRIGGRVKNKSVPVSCAVFY